MSYAVSNCFYLHVSSVVVFQAPTFKDGDLVVNESGAICLDLEEKYSNDENRLIPTDVGQRALVYQRMFESSNIQSNVMSPLFYYKMTKKKEDWEETYLSEKREAAETEIARWSSYLGDRDYLVGDKFTMADVFFFPYVAMLIRLGITFEKNTNLQRYYDNLSKRSSVQETWPPHWKEGAGPDFMADLKV